MPDADVAAIRHFSRYYTRRIGVLEDSLLGSGLTLPQGRLLFEIAQSEPASATPGALAVLLGLDPGYVSRLVVALEAGGLVTRQASARDGRSVVLQLTADGTKVFEAIDARSQGAVAGIVGRLSQAGRQRVVGAMRTIEQEFEGNQPQACAAVIRNPHPGDIGWVVHRHGALYNLEYGWDWTFEALVARIAGEFIERFDARHDCCRIAETQGVIVGAAFVVRSGKPGVAKLRMVYVEPTMRGTGLGRRLVEDCMAFARAAGNRRMTLWTNDPLVAARRLYQRLGFEMTASEPVTAFGKDMMSETWERDI